MGRFPDLPPAAPTFPNTVEELPHLNAWGSETDQQGGGEPRWCVRTLCRLTVGSSASVSLLYSSRHWRSDLVSKALSSTQVPANLNQHWRCHYPSPRRRINRLLAANLDEPLEVEKPRSHFADRLAD